jgi:hypothetical protein
MNFHSARADVEVWAIFLFGNPSTNSLITSRSLGVQVAKRWLSSWMSFSFFRAL